MFDLAEFADLHAALIRADFGMFCEQALAPLGFRPAPHHRLMIRELEAVARGKTQRLMINMPPGSAKSTYGSVLFPAWLLAQRPNMPLIGAGNTDDLAKSFSRKVMTTIRDNADVLGMSLVRDNQAEWETTNGGSYRAAGVGAAIAGKRAQCAIIDDPTRSRADADSERVRETQWAWFTGDLRTRLRPGASIVVIMTRWHEDDLGGRLLTYQPDLWRVIDLPAIAEDDDALGRQPGEWLWSGDDAYDYAGELKRVYAEYRAAGAMRDWYALYQQRPRPLDGSLYKIGMIEVLDVAPAGRNIVRAWDQAATKQTGTRNPDWTAGVKLMRTSEGRYVVLDVVRMRGGPDEVDTVIKNTAAQDGHAVKIGLAQDPGAAGKARLLDQTRKLTGYTIESSPETGDKATRAAPGASQVNGGNISMVRGPWNRAFLDELAGFPSGEKDDQVDALSRAFGMVGLGAPPLRISAEALAAAASFRR